MIRIVNIGRDCQVFNNFSAKYIFGKHFALNFLKKESLNEILISPAKSTVTYPKMLVRIWATSGVLADVGRWI